MNWVGGARSRVKFQGDRRLQKEFFERKKLDLKFEKLQKASKNQSTKKKKTLSQDLVALRTVSNASMKAGNSPRAVKVQHIDLDHHPRMGLSGRLDNRVGIRPPRVPESVELPYSPDLFPSKLQLKESLSPSGHGKDAKNPFKHRNDESVLSCREMAGSFPLLSDSKLPMPMTLKNESETRHTRKKTRAPYSPPQRVESQFGVDGRFASNTSKTSPKTTQNFCKPSVHNTSAQTDTRTKNPWRKEGARPSGMIEVHEQFQSPLSTPKERGGSDHSKVSRIVEDETWFPYSYPHVQRQPKDICMTKGDQILKHRRNNRHLPPETTMFHQQVDNYEGSQTRMKTIWTKKDSSTDTDYRLVTSPVNISIHPAPELNRRTSTQTNPINSTVTENVQSDIQTQSRVEQVIHDTTMTLPAFGDHRSTPSKLSSTTRPSTGSSKLTDRHSSSLFEYRNLKLPNLLEFDNGEYEQKLKRLWLPEDFQPSPSSSQKASRETPNVSLSAYTSAFQQPLTSKWETFLDSPDKTVSPLLAGFNVPHTPSPNFWKTPSQRRQKDPSCCFSDSRAVGSRMSSFIQGMWNHSDSEISSVYRQSKNKMTTGSSFVCDSTKLQKATSSFSSLYSQTRDATCMETNDSELNGNPEFDWRHDLLAQRQMKPPHAQCRKDATEHTVPTSDCTGLATPVSTNVKHQALKPLTPKLRPKKESRAEEVLLELEQLEALSDPGDACVGTKRKAAVQLSPPKVKKAHQESHRSRSVRDWQAAEGHSVVHSSDDSETDPSGSTDGVDEKQTSQLQNDGQNATAEDSFETIPDSDTAVHDATVLESGECTDADSDFDQSVHDVVETMVHNVVMTENRNNLASVRTTDQGRMQILWSASDTDLQNTGQHSPNISCYKPHVLQVNSKHSLDQRVKVQLKTEVVSVHTQTDWSLVHVSFPPDWLPGTPLLAKNGVDQGVQWESPSPQPLTDITQRDMELAQQKAVHYTPTGAPASSEQHPTPLSLLSSEEPRLAESAMAPPEDLLLSDTGSERNKTKIEFHSPKQSTKPVLLALNIEAADCRQTSTGKTPQNLPVMSRENMTTENIKISGSLSSERDLLANDGTSSLECQQSDKEHKVFQSQQKAPEPNLSQSSKPLHYVEVSRSEQNIQSQTELPTHDDAVHFQTTTPEQAVADSSSSPRPSAEGRAEMSCGNAIHTFPHTEDKAIAYQELVITKVNRLPSLAQSEKSAMSGLLLLSIKEKALHTEEPLVYSSAAGRDLRVVDQDTAPSTSLKATFNPNQSKASLNVDPLISSYVNQESNRNSSSTQTDVENKKSDTLSTPSAKS